MVVIMVKRPIDLVPKAGRGLEFPRVTEVCSAGRYKHALSALYPTGIYFYLLRTATVQSVRRDVISLPAALRWCLYKTLCCSWTAATVRLKFSCKFEQPKFVRIGHRDYDDTAFESYVEIRIFFSIVFIVLYILLWVVDWNKSHFVKMYILSLLSL